MASINAARATLLPQLLRYIVFALVAGGVAAKASSAAAKATWKIGDAVPVTCLNRTM
jgi:hypothetical protein